MQQQQQLFNQDTKKQIAYFDQYRQRSYPIINKKVDLSIGIDDVSKTIEVNIVAQVYLL
jgi:hypothetical protein